MVKCLTHGLRGVNRAVQRRLATLTVTMLISACWQLSSEVDLRRIFDVCKRWANSGSHEFVKKNMVRYMRPRGRFAHCTCKNVAWTRGRDRQAEVEGECCIFTLGVRQLPVLASCIEIYYFIPGNFFLKNGRFQKTTTITNYLSYRVLSFILLLWCHIIHKNLYSGVSECADYESSVRFSNFKMADPIRWIKLWKKIQFFEGKNRYVSTGF